MSRFCNIFSKANIHITIFTEQGELKNKLNELPNGFVTCILFPKVEDRD